jgi:hypothetical protein
MPVKGLDANTPLGPHADCIAKSGFHFVGRYIKRTNSALTHAEAQVLSTAGLSIVSVVEIGFPTHAAYFSQAKGQEDGSFAYSYAHNHLKQPVGSCLYFAVDYDASLADIKGPITSYFKGILDAFHNSGNATGGHPAYALGVYGSGLTCATLLKTTAVSYAWLSMSMGWQGSRSFKGWNLKQSAGGTVCGVLVDYDASNGHGGGWTL